MAKSKTDHLKTLLIKNTLGDIEVSLSQKPKQTSEAFIKLVESGAFALGRSFQDSSASLSEFFIGVEGNLEELNANTVRYKNYAPKDTLGLPVTGHLTKDKKLVKKNYRLNKKLTNKNQMLKCIPSKDKPCVDKDYSVKIISMSIKP
ncbi:hypothetical protein MRY82_05360 [bacterium]|nr:hypothetical protein [bacterium]